jgi:hypothetical protein
VDYVRVLCLALASAALVIGCQQRQTDGEADEAVDTMAMTDAGDEMAGGAEEAGDPLAQAEGTWNIRSVPESGDDTTATLGRVEVAGGRWTLHLEGRDPIEGIVSTSGDTIIVDAGPFESVRRAGVTVRTRAAYRIEGDRMIGTTVARYETSGADSVLRLRTEGTRAP